MTEAVAEGVTRATEAAITRITALEKLTTAKARLHAAEQRIEELDNQNRKNCVIINCVPETNDETKDSQVVNVGRAAGVPIPTISIDRAYRLGRPQPGKIRPIMAKFTTSGPRQKLFENRKELSADRVKEHPILTPSVISRIFISECLSPKNQHLLFVARQLKRQKALWAAYTTNGRVKVKKSEGDSAVNITELDDLERVVGAGAIREFRPRGTAAASTARRQADLAWQAADAMNSWVTVAEGLQETDPAERTDPAAELSPTQPHCVSSVSLNQTPPRRRHCVRVHDRTADSRNVPPY